MPLDEKKDILAREAQRLHDRWEPRGGLHNGNRPGWNATTYCAWFRHFGCYKTDVQQKISWNEQFLKGLKDLVEEPWVVFEAHCDKITKQTTKVLQDLLDDISEVIQPLLLKGKTDFGGQVKLQQSAIEVILQEENIRLTHVLHNIWITMVKEVPDCYLAKVLEPTYRNVSEVRGTGASRQAFDAIKARLGDTGRNGVFAEVSTYIDRALKEDARAHTKPLVSKVTAVLRLIEKEVKVLIQKKQSSPESDPKLKEIGKKFRKWTKLARAELGAVLEQVGRAETACEAVHDQKQK